TRTGLTVDVPASTSALAGATDRTPAPNAATATSAMRLKLVFVDIIFLSIVDPETISGSACAPRALTYVMRKTRLSVRRGPEGGFFA
ncbi:MAG: hypothetical protein RL144_1110, partial [Actinomycetota bacterium]